MIIFQGGKSSYIVAIYSVCFMNNMSLHALFMVPVFDE